MSKGVLGGYVVIENGELYIIEEPSQELMSKAVSGISTQMLRELESKSEEELKKINNGKTLVLKHLGVHIPEQNFFAESTYVEKSKAEKLGYFVKKLNYNNLTDMVIPTDDRFTIVWG